MSPSSQVKTHHRSTYAAISAAQSHLSTKGKSAVITGAGTGVGAAIAQSLAVSGIAVIALLGRTEKTLLETKALVKEKNASTQVHTYVVDVVNAAATSTALESFAQSIGGKIDILFANAGYMPDLASITGSDPEDWWQGYEVNVRGNYNLLRAFDPLAGPGASVIHISSNVVHLPYLWGFSSYRSSKCGSTKMFEYYHNERPDLFVLQVHPGYLPTVLTSKIGDPPADSPYQYDDISLAGDFAVWAVSEEAKFLNGRFVWAAWDVDELKGMEKEVEEDVTKFTIGLLS